MTAHIYHYNTHAEKRFFLGSEHRHLYDLIAVNGNIISHSPEGSAGMLATAGKEFFIDPQTHAFQHPTRFLKRDISDREKGEPPKYAFKPSVDRLARERLGFPFDSVITNDRPLTADIFLDSAGRPMADVIKRNV